MSLGLYQFGQAKPAVLVKQESSSTSLGKPANVGQLILLSTMSLDCDEIYHCLQPDEAESMRISILIYVMVFHIYDDQTVVMEDTRL